MLGRKHLAGGLAAALLFLSLAPAGAVLAAQSQNNGTVVASGLASPRGLTADANGNLYVAESGKGGDKTITIGEGQNAQQLQVGMTGQVTRIGADGTKTVVASGLPSAGSPEGEIAGPEGITYANGALWVTISGGIPGVTNLPNEGSVIMVDPQSGNVKSVANIEEYEFSKNPDTYGPDSNPYGLALGKDGMLYVADAGGNTLYKLNPSSGALSVAAIFAGVPLPAPLQGQGPFAQGNPSRGGKMELDPVPTGVAISPSGGVYVAQLSGFPFLEGITKVSRLEAGGKLADAVTGLTMAVDVEFGPDGNMYVTEFGRFSLASNPPNFVPNSGRVLRISPDGSKQVVADGLNAPNGLAFDKAGNLYVVANSVSPTDGQVLLLGNMMTGGGVGMPRTGTGFPFEQVLYTGLLLVAAGCSVLLIARPLQARKREIE